MSDPTPKTTSETICGTFVRTESDGPSGRLLTEEEMQKFVTTKTTSELCVEPDNNSRGVYVPIDPTRKVIEEAAELLKRGKPIKLNFTGRGIPELLWNRELQCWDVTGTDLATPAEVEFQHGILDQTADHDPLPACTNCEGTGTVCSRCGIPNCECEPTANPDETCPLCDGAGVQDK